MENIGTIQRAFELARGGTCSSVEEIRARLKSEGHYSIVEHLSGPTIQRQLRTLIASARAA